MIGELETGSLSPALLARVQAGTPAMSAADMSMLLGTVHVRARLFISVRRLLMESCSALQKYGPQSPESAELFIGP